MHHSKLTREERYQIDALIQAGRSQAAIARQLKRSPSTISRELKRNGAAGSRGVSYDAAAAAKRAAARRRQIGGRCVELSDEQIEWIVERQTVRALRGAPVRSITADNGKEFANHRQIAARLGAPFFFADPYRASQRGSVENANGLVRDFLPKGTDLARVSAQSLRSVQDNINNRPMKMHGWLSRNQVYNRNVASLRSVL